MASKETVVLVIVLPFGLNGAMKAAKEEDQLLHDLKFLDRMSTLHCLLKKSIPQKWT